MRLKVDYVMVLEANELIVGLVIIGTVRKSLRMAVPVAE